MMGKDIERMLTNINSLMYDVGDLIFAIQSELMYNDLIDSILSIFDDVKNDYNKMKNIDDQNYTDRKNFNNSIGSPWSEFDQLISSYNYIRQPLINLETMSPSKEDLLFILSLLNKLNIDIVNFKWALITYHDYIQRAFDNIYNDNVPSITFSNDSRGTQTTGNLSQKVSNNVSVKDADITPY